MEFKEIRLSNGDKVKVDMDDYDYLMQWRWKLHPQGYAARTSSRCGKWITILMHMLINNTPDGLETDHINNNKLDNRKCNLRSVTRSTNEHNNPEAIYNTSGVKGVCWDGSRQKWMSRINVNGKAYYVGRFNVFDEAVRARKEAEVCLL